MKSYFYLLSFLDKETTQVAELLHPPPNPLSLSVEDKGLLVLHYQYFDWSLMIWRARNPVISNFSVETGILEHYRFCIDPHQISANTLNKAVIAAPTSFLKETN